MARLIGDICALFEYLGGMTDQPPARWPAWLHDPVWWGLWWATLILVTLVFSGQTSKFIYIDF